MKVTVTGATGTLGRRSWRRCASRGDEVIVAVATRPGARKRRRSASVPPPGRPAAGPAPAEALAGRRRGRPPAGEPVAQRWNERAPSARSASRASWARATSSRALRTAEPRPPSARVGQSAIGFYGPRGDERVDESEPAGGDFLAEVVRGVGARGARAAEQAACASRSLRTGVVLSREGGALGQMLPPFKLGVGGPVAGGRQYVPWVHADDVVGAYLFALDTTSRVSGPVNVTAPEPVTNREFSKALGRVLQRPAFAPVPELAIARPLRRDGGRSWSRASGWCRPASRSSATPSVSRSWKAPCARRSAGRVAVLGPRGGRRTRPVAVSPVAPAQQRIGVAACAGGGGRGAVRVHVLRLLHDASDRYRPPVPTAAAGLSGVSRGGRRPRRGLGRPRRSPRLLAERALELPARVGLRRPEQPDQMAPSATAAARSRGPASRRSPCGPTGTTRRSPTRARCRAGTGPWRRGGRDDGGHAPR